MTKTPKKPVHFSLVKTPIEIYPKPHAFTFRQFLFGILPQDCFTTYTRHNTVSCNVVLRNGFSQKLFWKVKGNGLIDTKLVIYKKIWHFLPFFCSLYQFEKH